MVNGERNQGGMMKDEKNDRCPECGGEMRLKSGRYGKFWGCSNYPKCNFTCDAEIGSRFSLNEYRAWEREKELDAFLCGLLYEDAGDRI